MGESYNIGIYFVSYDGKNIYWETITKSTTGQITDANEAEFERFLGHLIRKKGPYTF